MKKILVGLGVVASLYATSVNISTNTTDYSFSGSVTGSTSSDERKDDTNNANDSDNCYNAFSGSSATNYISSIITQIQNQDFLLYITNKCNNTTDLNITLINKQTGEPLDSKYYNISDEGEDVIKVNVHNAFKDLLVHFDYNTVETTNNSGASGGTNGGSGSSSTTTTKTHHEENSTDDFAVRPYTFDINVKNSTVFVGKPLKIDISAIGKGGDDDISTNYNAHDTDLNTKPTDSNTYLSYFYDIINGKLTNNHKFIFKKPSDDVKIEISEKVGKEWAIVDADDTVDNRRLIKKGESNSLKVNETSKSWVGVGTGEKENDPTNKTIQSDIRDNANKNLKFHKIGW